VIQPESQIIRRQDAPKVFDMTTVAYIVDANFIIKHNGMFEGRVKSVVIPQERAIDIDNLIDFKVAECLLNQKEKAE
jgi:N-acylneuraminate cytidylyltransferase